MSARLAARLSGSLLTGAGVLGLLWALVVWQWQDPFTALYTLQQQGRLAAAYDRIASSFRPLPPASPSSRRTTAATAVARVRREARLFRHSLQTGQPLGRLSIPRLGLEAVVVVGTDQESLKKGPGWYQGSFLPGEGELVYIAGHRTTYLAPFAEIDRLRPGDRVRLETPYATVVYRVRTHVIVPASDVARLRSHGRELLALQACHPRFFATHRYIVYAQPVRLLPREGRPSSLPAGRGRGSS
jgi:sortase A